MEGRKRRLRSGGEAGTKREGGRREEEDGRMVVGAGWQGGRERE